MAVDHPTGAETHHAHLPAWRRPTAGESRLPASAAVVVVIAVQVPLPSRLMLRRQWLLPALELLVLVALVVANPTR